MESQNKESNSLGVMEETKNSNQSVRGAKKSELLLRVVVLMLTMAAAIVMGVDKQTTHVQVKLVDSLPPISVPVVAKWNYLSAFVFFVASNAIACAYTAISLFLAVSGKKIMIATTAILDLIMVALLFASTGAATSVGVIGRQGNSHVKWNKVCNVFGKFCNQVAVAIGLSLVASLLLLLLIVISILRVQNQKM